jgi:DNA-binding MarR family transcriptional regulator
MPYGRGVSRSRASAEDLAEQLRQVMGPLLRRLRAEPAEQALTYPLRSLLRRLEVDGPATTADLARAELITPQTTGALVAELETGGYVTRSDDANDGRRRVVALTAAGRKSMTDGRAARQSWLARRIADRLDADEQRTLATALALLRKIIET